MNKVNKISSLRAAIKSAKEQKKRVVFVPTMGNLHEGHLDLVRRAQKEGDFIVVSIYVNPMQFGENEDLANYPRTESDDARLLGEMDVDLLFLPDDDAMYPGDISQHTRVDIPTITTKYCGEQRPTHFRGVATVVARLFNIVQPDCAIFGKKDYQQLFVVRQLVNDLAFPIEIVGSETTREESGLAMSSRNGYLTDEERQVAPMLFQVLTDLAAEVEQGAKNLQDLTDKSKQRLEKAGFEPHYLEVCRRSDLTAAEADDKELVILIAAKLGETRLIDNLEVDR
ncbi:MAG: pantoate--beta-alanine ligase [Arenicella sp.]